MAAHPSCLVCCVWPLLCLSLRSCDKRMHHWLFELLLTCDAHDIPATVWHADLPEQRSGVAAVNSRKRSADDSQAAKVSYKGKTTASVSTFFGTLSNLHLAHVGARELTVVVKWHVCTFSTNQPGWKLDCFGVSCTQLGTNQQHWRNDKLTHMMQAALTLVFSHRVSSHQLCSCWTFNSAVSEWRCRLLQGPEGASARLPAQPCLL